MGTSVFTLAQTTVTFTLTLRPPLNSLARPTLTERPEEAEAGKITSEHFFTAALCPPLSGGFTGLGLHPSPPKPDTHAGRLASAPSPMMIDRESGDLGTINHRTLEPEEPSRPFKSYPAPFP